MTTENNRYSTVAIVLHWAIAAFILINLPLGLVMEKFPNPVRGQLVWLHLSFGFMVFALSMARIAWRLTHKAPPLPDHYAAWERLAAHAAHAALYVAMVVMPILGWLILSANLRRPMVVFWTFVLPPFGPVVDLPPGPAKKALHDQFVQMHSIGGYILIALLVLHVAAALKHQFWDKDPEFQRMGVGRTPGPAAAELGGAS